LLTAAVKALLNTGARLVLQLAVGLQEATNVAVPGELAVSVGSAVVLPLAREATIDWEELYCGVTVVNVLFLLSTMSKASVFVADLSKAADVSFESFTCNRMDVTGQVVNVAGSLLFPVLEMFPSEAYTLASPGAVAVTTQVLSVVHLPVLSTEATPPSRVDHVNGPT
jgi:hypothetical protein